jgi:uncharacterized protein (DUF924 family)
MHGAADEKWIGEVIGFWFDELGPDAWFRKDATVDQTIRERFLILYEVLAKRPAAEALASPERALATVLVLDQFPRNLFRGSAQAFARAKYRAAQSPRGSRKASERTSGCSSICRSSTARTRRTRRAQWS